MLYTKYESSVPCSFRQEDFWMFHFKTYLLTPWPTGTVWGIFDRGPPRDHSCEVWSKSNKRFQRRCGLKKLLTDGRMDGRTMDDGQWAITKAHIEHFVPCLTAERRCCCCVVAVAELLLLLFTLLFKIMKSHPLQNSKHTNVQGHQNSDTPIALWPANIIIDKKLNLELCA